MVDGIMGMRSQPLRKALHVAGLDAHRWAAPAQEEHTGNTGQASPALSMVSETV